MREVWRFFYLVGCYFAGVATAAAWQLGDPMLSFDHALALAVTCIGIGVTPLWWKAKS